MASIAWIMQGIRDLQESQPVRTSMDKLYSLVSTSESETEVSSGSKRKRRDEVSDYDFDHETTKR